MAVVVGGELTLKSIFTINKNIYIFRTKTRRTVHVRVCVCVRLRDKSVDEHSTMPGRRAREGRVRGGNYFEIARHVTDGGG